MVVKLAGVSSNWELLIFYLIQPLVNETKRNFTRSRMLGKNYDNIYIMLAALFGHKKNPTSVEQTIQRTLQNMRDKGWITFLRSHSGDYELTDQGFEELKRHKDNLQKLNSLSQDETALLRKIVGIKQDEED